MKTISTEEISIEKLISTYRRYIIKIASTLTNDNYIKEELIAEGNISIWKAYNNFNSAEGELHSYLISYIRGSMLNYLTTSSRTIKIPANKVHQLNREGKAFINILSLDMQIGDEDSSTLGEMVEDHVDDNSLDDIGEAKLRLLRKYIPQLNTQHQNIIKMFYIEEKTLTEIAKQLDMSLQNVSEQHQRAIEKLQYLFKIKDLTYKKTKGYTFNPKRKKWVASQTVNGIRTNLGAFETEEEAALAVERFRRNN